jgi:hypothetical protein
VQEVGHLKQTENLVLIKNDLRRAMDSSNWKKRTVCRSLARNGARGDHCDVLEADFEGVEATLRQLSLLGSCEPV